MVSIVSMLMFQLISLTSWVYCICIFPLIRTFLEELSLLYSRKVGRKTNLFHMKTQVFSMSHFNGLNRCLTQHLCSSIKCGHHVVKTRVLHVFSIYTRYNKINLKYVCSFFYIRLIDNCRLMCCIWTVSSSTIVRSRSLSRWLRWAASYLPYFIHVWTRYSTVYVSYVYVHFPYKFLSG